MSRLLCPRCRVDVALHWVVAGCNDRKVTLGVCKEHGVIDPITDEGDPMIIGKAGDKAYLDGISGLVPCVVLKVTENHVHVKMDAKRGVRSWHGINEYGDWNSEEEFGHHWIIPEKAIRWPDGRSTFNPSILPCKWEVS